MAIARRDGAHGSDPGGRDVCPLIVSCLTLANRLQRFKTPSELIQDEALVSLIQEVQELRERCASLEDVNAELKRHLEDMRHLQMTAIAESGHEAESAEARKAANLSGYAESEASASSETAVNGECWDSACASHQLLT